MEPEGSLPRFQVPAACPCPEPDQSSPSPPPPIPPPEDPSYCYPPICAWVFPVVSLPQVSHQNPVFTSHLTHTCYMPAHLILLVLITRIIFGEEYKALSSSLCNFLHSPVTSSLLGSNIPLRTLFSNTLN